MRELKEGMDVWREGEGGCCHSGICDLKEQRLLHACLNAEVNAVFKSWWTLE